MSSLLDAKRVWRQQLVRIHSERFEEYEKLALELDSTVSAVIEFVLNYGGFKLDEDFEHAFTNYRRDREFRKCYAVALGQKKRFRKFGHKSVVQRRKETRRPETIIQKRPVPARRHPRSGDVP